jgi:hypothetical protein
VANLQEIDASNNLGNIHFGLGLYEVEEAALGFKCSASWFWLSASRRVVVLCRFVSALVATKEGPRHLPKRWSAEEEFIRVPAARRVNVDIVRLPVGVMRRLQASSTGGGYQGAGITKGAVSRLETDRVSRLDWRVYMWTACRYFAKKRALAAYPAPFGV